MRSTRPVAILDGHLHDQFQLDVFQGGAGTSTNINVNEVIANRALERMGRQKGEGRYCHPRSSNSGRRLKSEMQRLVDDY